MGKRIVIIGTSCSGKSTLAKKISAKLGIPHFELDNYYWKTNWTPSSPEDFVDRVKNIVEKDNWVICGNYGKVREILWNASTDIIWLDYPFYFVFYRAIKRSILRIVKKEKVCNNNIETFQKSFLSKDSIVLWVINTYWKRKKEFPILLSQIKDKNIFSLKNQFETNNFINEI